MRYRKIVALTAVFLALVLTTQDVFATSSSEINRKKQEAEAELRRQQEELEGIEGSLGELQGEYQEVAGEITALNEEIVNIMAAITLLEEEITAKEAEIEQAKLDLAAAIERENQQYEAMKLRIQFMYETGESSFMAYFFEAGNIADMLTRAEYIDSIYASDRTMLEEYVATKEEVVMLKENLEIEESELLASKDECEGEKAELETALSEMRAVAADYETQIAGAKKQAAAYAAKIKKQNEEIRKIEAERKAAIRREQEAANKNNGGNTNVSKKTGSSYTVDTSIITSASGSETGKQAALYAVTFLGNPYKAGGTSLTQGTDCSGFTYSVYQNYGIKLPRSSYGQRSAGTEVSYENAQPGDLVCYAGHVALYIGGGLIVHASSEKTGIKISNATYKSIITIRRVV